MPKLTFTGDPNPNAKNPPTAELCGVVFPLGEAVDVADDVFERLKTHSHFTAATRGRVENLGDWDGDGTAGGAAQPATDLRAIHRGRGSFSIMRGDEEIIEGLKKDQAHEFNDMGPADKAAFIEAAK